MRVVRFVAEAVEGGERELVDAVDGVCVVGRAGEAEFRREVEEDVGRLAEEEVAVAEDGRGEGGRVRGGAGGGVGDEGFEERHVGFGVCVAEVEVGGVGFFEAEADVLAATGDGGPVD